MNYGETNSLIWGGDDAFTHMLCVGPTRCGKTSTVLQPMIYQILLAKKAGIPVGLSLIEPKGDVAALVAEMCEAMEIPNTYIDPENSNSHVFNPMEGDIDDVAEATVAVLKSLFGKQQDFFAIVQELSARNITKLLKELHGDNIDLIDVVHCLRDETVLQTKVKELKQKQGTTDLVQFFEAELLGSMKDHFRKLVLGLRAQVENLTGNRYLKKIMQGKSSINIDKHFLEGGVLAVNTSLGKLRKAGDAFGMFVAMHLQSATFRRPGTERTRVPHYLIIDEYSRYINPDVEMFLSIAASYRVSGIFATQSLGQLEVESGKIGPKAMKQAILTNCRNKIAFSGLSAADAKEFSEEFGKDLIMDRQNTFEGALIPHLLPKSYRLTEKEKYRYHQTLLQDGLPRFHYIYKFLQDGVPQRPGMAKGNFIPRDWKERLVDHKKKTFDLKKLKGLFVLLEKMKQPKEEVESVNPLLERWRQSHVTPITGNGGLTSEFQVPIQDPELDWPVTQQPVFKKKMPNQQVINEPQILRDKPKEQPQPIVEESKNEPKIPPAIDSDGFWG